MLVNSLDCAKFSPVVLIRRRTPSPAVEVGLQIVVHLESRICLSVVQSLVIEPSQAREIRILDGLVVALVAANALNSTNCSSSLDSMRSRILCQKFLTIAIVSCWSSNEHVVSDSVVSPACHLVYIKQITHNAPLSSFKKVIFRGYLPYLSWSPLSCNLTSAILVASGLCLTPAWCPLNSVIP